MDDQNTTNTDIAFSIDDYKYGFSKPEEHVFKTTKGLDREKVIQISKIKNEPEWMLEFRLKSFDTFLAKKNARLGS